MTPRFCVGIPSNVNEISSWLSLLKIKADENKSTRVMFTNRKIDLTDYVILNSVAIPPKKNIYTCKISRYIPRLTSNTE